MRRTCWAKLPSNVKDIMEDVIAYDDPNYYTCIIRLGIHANEAVLCKTAARMGSLKLLQWARMNGCPKNDSTCQIAAANGQLHVLQWARDDGYKWDEKTCTAAARGGHLRVLKWARQNHGSVCPWDENTCTAAASGGHLHVLKWVRAHGCPWNHETFAIAASSKDIRNVSWKDDSQLSILKWLKANNCPWTTTTAAAAAYSGNMKILQWLFDNACPWDESACFSAAEAGHLHVLKWIKSLDLPWTCTVGFVAAEQGHFDILEWLVINDYADLLPMARGAARSARLDVLLWYKNNGFELDEYTFTAGVLGTRTLLAQMLQPNNMACSRTVMLDWLFANGCTSNMVHQTAISRQLPANESDRLRVKEEQLEVVKWAINRGYAWSRHLSMNAKACGYDNIVEWVNTTNHSDSLSIVFTTIAVTALLLVPCFLWQRYKQINW